jgi:PAS domain S-box-containing protein
VPLRSIQPTAARENLSHLPALRLGQAHLQRSALSQIANDSASIDPALGQLLEGLPDGIVVLDDRWRITYANAAARKISRIRSEDLHGKTHWELYPKTVGTSVEEIYRSVMADRRERMVNAFYYEPFQIWLNVRVVPVTGGIALYYRDITETHDAQAAGRAAEKQLAQVLATTTDGVVSLDCAYTINYMNQRAMEILAPSGEVLRTNLWESFPHANFPGSPFVEHYGRAMNERVASGFLAFYPEPLNAWLDLSARPSEEGIIVFFRDVTEQKRKEDELRSSEERYRVLTELSPLSQWTANAQGLVLYANRRFLDYIGHDFVPKTGEEYIDCFDPEDRARVVSVWTDSVTTGEDYDIEARLLRAADGASRWWRLRALPVRDDAGVIQQWLGTAIDIHETRIAADQLRAQYAEIDKQRREMETIYRGSPIGMALYDATDLRLLRINDRQAEIFRLPAAEAIGKRYDELAAGVPTAHALIRRAASGEAVLNHELEGALDRRPEEYRYWNINYSPIFDERGKVLAVASATVEITQQKRAEAALVQSEKLAAVGRMASSIAHEINNPLESVTNLIYIARTYAILPEVQHLLDLADQELRRVSIIANQTLRFHKQASLPREISCSDLFSTVLSLYEGRLRNSSISVENRKRAQRPISCFEGDIRQVLNNLVGNSIDAMPTGGRLLLRSRESTDWRPAVGPPRRGLTLTVADTGSGISETSLKRLFEPFFTTKGINGNGLGLWISADIVERHEGRLLLRSSQSPKHRGTVFSLFLPFPIANTTDVIQ